MYKIPAVDKFRISAVAAGRARIIDLIKNINHIADRFVLFDKRVRINLKIVQGIKTDHQIPQFTEIMVADAVQKLI